MFNFARNKKSSQQNWQQDNALQASTIDTNIFMEISQDLMLVLGPDHQMTHANDALLAATGIKDHELETYPFISLFHEEDRPHILSTIQSMTTQASTMATPTVEFEARINTPSGTRTLQWHMIGKGANTYCTGRDITESKAQESALKRSQNQLREAESIGRIGRWKWKVGQDQIAWSDEIFRIWGVNADAFTPTFASMYEMVHEDDQDRMDQTLQRAVINNNDFDVDFSITMPTTGEERYIRCEGRCGLDDDGQVTALYGIMQDMTERMLYARELKTAKEAAERAYAAKTQFLANMSHELRTPLNAIIGFSEMIQSEMFGPLGSEKYAEYATDIRDSGGHLLDLIGDILDMSKIEAGKYELDLEELRINEIVDTAIKMIESRASENGIIVKINSSFKNETRIIADRRACLQIMLNILSNAVKFTEKGGKIEINCTANTESIALTVADNGIGIPANKLATITNPFEQVSPHYTRNHEGSGLGLAITKELVSMHGGTLDIQSQIEQGTSVNIILPIAASPQDEKTDLFFEN